MGYVFMGTLLGVVVGLGITAIIYRMWANKAAKEELRQRKAKLKAQYVLSDESGEETVWSGDEKTFSPSSASDEESQGRHNESTQLLQSDADLLKVFRQVMRAGMKLRRYAKKGSDEVHLKLKGNSIILKTGALKRKETVDLKDVLYIEIGKRTAIFQAGAASGLDDAVCFSLVLNNNSTVDLQATSQVERDAITTGFSGLLREIQRRA